MLSVTRVGKTLTGIEVDRRSGAIVVVGNFGLAVLAPDAREVIWSSKDPAPAARVSIGSDGVIAALDEHKQVHLFGPGGERLSRFTVDAEFAKDIAVAAKERAVLVTGIRVRGGGEACGRVVPLAHLAAYSYMGEPL